VVPLLDTNVELSLGTIKPMESMTGWFFSFRVVLYLLQPINSSSSYKSLRQRADPFNKFLWYGVVEYYYMWLVELEVLPRIPLL